MSSIKKVLLLVSFILFASVLSAQVKCDCNHLPANKNCFIECLRIANAKQLQSMINIDSQTAKAIASVPNRKNLKTTDDFKKVLPPKIYEQLIIFEDELQVNSGGNNIQGNNNVQTVIYNQHLKEMESAPTDDFNRPELQLLYCEDQGISFDNGKTYGSVAIMQSLGERGRVAFILDSSNRELVNYSLYINYTEMSMGKVSKVFGPGDKVRLFMSRPAKYMFEEFSVNIFFYDATGIVYCQKLNASPGERFKLSEPLKVDWGEFNTIKKNANVK